MTIAILCTDMFYPIASMKLTIFTSFYIVCDGRFGLSTSIVSQPSLDLLALHITEHFGRKK